MVSIIITIYNSEKYLKQCLTSIKNQTYKDFEAVMVDDGSTDGSRAIALSFLEDRRFRLFNDKHVGFPEAKNIGLRNANGDYIIFFDSDDVADPHWLEYLYGAAVNTQADITTCWYKKFTEESPKAFSVNSKDQLHITKIDYAKMNFLLDSHCFSYMGNKLIKKELYNNIVFNDVIALSDVQVMYKIFDKANFITRIHEPLVHYRRHPESMTATTLFCNISKEYGKYRIELFVDVLAFIYEKYKQTRFMCKKVLTKELSDCLSAVGKEYYNNIYKDSIKESADKILADNDCLPIYF